MTCAEARRWLSLRQPLPLEAGVGVTAQVAEHVHHCPACATFTARAADFDTAMSKAMRAVPVPSGLRHRLLIQAENARRAQARQWLFRVTVPLAASLLLAILYGHFHSQQATPTPIELADVQRWVETDLPATRRLPLTPAEAQLHLPAEIRNRWNLHYHTESYQARYQGRWVTVLEFRRGNSQAIMLILPPDQIEPRQLQAYSPRYLNDPRILGDQEKGEYIALVVIRSGQYSDFLKPTLLPSGA